MPYLSDKEFLQKELSHDCRQRSALGMLARVTPMAGLGLARCDAQSDVFLLSTDHDVYIVDFGRVSSEGDVPPTTCILLSPPPPRFDHVAGLGVYSLCKRFCQGGPSPGCCCWGWSQKPCVGSRPDRPVLMSESVVSSPKKSYPPPPPPPPLLALPNLSPTPPPPPNPLSFSTRPPPPPLCRVQNTCMLDTNAPARGAHRVRDQIMHRAIFEFHRSLKSELRKVQPKLS